MMVELDVYVKAGIITLFVFLFGLMFVKYIDQDRLDRLNAELDKVSYGSESARLLQLYTLVFNLSQNERCSYFGREMNQSMVRSMELASLLEKEKDNSLSGSYLNIKHKFLLTNMELYLYSRQYRASCETRMESLLYFYDGKAFCPGCLVAEGKLESLKQRCPDVRVFAFPYNSDESLLSLLVSKYGVATVPAIIRANDEKVGTVSDLGAISCVSR
ncbi:hypothetical protein COS70_02265 [Candidatus Micrarchaeota archaeon CG06_land_8_20_14_3_00_50_6]|nr:MAG: hypothetical protein COS70_02265 [Candidatus Micrarchaeota archaeon CG06_land_8_20_14_3_00_50_6]